MDSVRNVVVTGYIGHRLGLATIAQMCEPLVDACEHPPDGNRVVEVPELRRPPTFEPR